MINTNGFELFLYGTERTVNAQNDDTQRLTHSVMLAPIVH